MKLKCIFAILLAFISVHAAWGQKVATDPEMLREIVRRIKSMQTVGYDFLIAAAYPDGSKDSLSGSMYMDRQQQLFFNESPAVTFLLTSKWFYRADHSTKRITILDVDKYYKKETLKNEFFSGVFGGQISSVFIDSVLLKRGHITTLRIDDSLVTLSVKVPPAVYHVERVDLVFNTSRQLPETLQYHVIYPWKEGKMIKQLVRCSAYRTQPTVGKKLDPATYFTIGTGKPVLMQYKDYKVFSNI